MDQGNFGETLDVFQMRRPFRTFVIELVTGERLFVDDPTRVHYKDFGTAVFWHKSGRIKVFDHEGVVSFSDAIDVATAEDDE